MARNRHYKSKAPLDTLDDSRSFIAHLSKAFNRVEAGESPSQSFSEFVAGLGYFPIDGDQWMTLRDEFLNIAEMNASAEQKVVVLMDARCPWLESDYIRGRRAAEKRPIPRDGKQPPIPSPFA